MPLLNTAEALYVGVTDASVVQRGEVVWPETIFLDPSIGIISTPDITAMAVEGPTRITAMVRADFDAGAASTDRFLAGQWGPSATTLGTYFWAARTTMVLGIYGTDNNRRDVTIANAAEQDTMLPQGVDAYIGWDWTGKLMNSLKSVDGLAWTTVRSTAHTISSRDGTAALTVGSHGATPAWQGRVYWMQQENYGRAQLHFAGVAGNVLVVNDEAAFQFAGDITIITDFTPSVWPVNVTGGASVVFGRMAGATAAWQVYFNNGSTSPTFSQYDSTGTNRAITSSVGLTGVSAGTRVRLAVTRVGADVKFFTSTDGAAWTQLGTTRTLAASTFRTGVAAITVASQTGSGLPFAGRIHRVALANGTATGNPGGTTVLEINENNAFTMTDATHFAAQTNQSVEVRQTAGNTVVQQQPTVIAWRFDAQEYPGSGTSYVDPRGRTWTLSAPGCIVID